MKTYFESPLELPEEFEKLFVDTLDNLESATETIRGLSLLCLNEEEMLESSNTEGFELLKH